MLRLAQSERVPVVFFGAPEMKLTLGTLAREAIESGGEKSLGSGVVLALREYLTALESGLPAAPFPRALLPRITARRLGVEIELSLDPWMGAAVEREMRRQLLTIEELTAHAVFLYLGGLNAEAA